MTLHLRSFQHHRIIIIMSMEYQGQIRSGLMHGQGILTYENKEVYQGKHPALGISDTHQHV